MRGKSAASRVSSRAATPIVGMILTKDDKAKLLKQIADHFLDPDAARKAVRAIARAVEHYVASNPRKDDRAPVNAELAGLNCLLRVVKRVSTGCVAEESIAAWLDIGRVPVSTDGRDLTKALNAFRNAAYDLRVDLRELCTEDQNDLRTIAMIVETAMDELRSCSKAGRPASTHKVRTLAKAIGSVHDAYATNKRKTRTPGAKPLGRTNFVSGVLAYLREQKLKPTLPVMDKRDVRRMLEEKKVLRARS